MEINLEPYFLLSLNNKIDDRLLLTLFSRHRCPMYLVEILSWASKDSDPPNMNIVVNLL